MSAKRRPDALTVRNQQRASDPAHSVWVSAHAGSGKTHVLASRVIRLLLDGVPPARILCLTFTKAAAANMSERVFKKLADWSVASDAKLRQWIAETGAPVPKSLADARKLFARAVETPGGLKIQTIHAFCERVLHLFPFEANVAADFRVIEPLEEAELLQEARRTALARLAEHEGGRAALAAVAEGTWDTGFVALVNDMLARRDLLEALGSGQRLAALRKHLRLAPDHGLEAVEHDILHGGIPCGEWLRIAERIAAGSKHDRDCAERLRQAAALAPDPRAIDPYFAVFLTAENAPRKIILTKGLADREPVLAERLAAEQARLLAMRETWLSCRIFARTQALDHVCSAVVEEYEKAKRARGLLDFADLIGKTDELLQRSAAREWVLFKLDGGIDHILVDEAQDTSELQWRILEALAKEFTAGQGRPRRPRTFFAVGDEKQSIFSFQGAAPARFEAMRRMFAARAEAAKQGFARVPLHVSFRSAPEILQCVDHVFATPERRRGLSNDDVALEHIAVKQGLPGLVEIWPVVSAQEPAPPRDWTLPLDAAGDASPPVRLAQKVARKIAALVNSGIGEQVESETPGVFRQVRAGDIMVLVRQRDAFFDAIIRALKQAGVDVAGADRLDVAGHIAVMDCLAAARASLLPDDDLTVATVLKSPLIGLDDDDLIALAPKRTCALIDALARSDCDTHKHAAAKLNEWREAAARMGPFDFFMRLLGPEGGRRALVARLGIEAHDALDEMLALALAHERNVAPSLVTFVASMETLSLDIRRDMEAASGAVRVMTVHAAKGLEAKIVFLPDTCGAPGGQHDPDLFPLGEENETVLAWSGGKANDPAMLTQAREKFRCEQDQEYRRLLYVAMTRAEERLYISGYANLQAPKETCWHNLICDALVPTCREEEVDGETVWRRGETPPNRPVRATGQHELSLLPPWLSTPAQPERPSRPPLRPSSALESADRADEQPSSSTKARERGVAVHSLLRRLPEVPVKARGDFARTFLRESAPDLADQHDSLARAALAVIAHPSLAMLFGENSIAEVAVAGEIARPGRPPVRIAGQIDRLAESDGHILFADFKTGAPPENEPAQPHLAQMALYADVLTQIYPGRPVRALLIYTEGPTIITIQPEVLAQARQNALAASA